MDFGQAISSGFRNYATFSGRAARSEYWYWVLFGFIGGIVSGIVDYAAFSDSSVSPLYAIFSLLLFLPSIAVAARRLHDLNQSAWWLLLFLFIWGAFFWKGTNGPNRFGPDPLGST